jgi:hypothetical protein|tara:strand:- start:77 stop:208 length:132 start_codon:yes stop_codon:yes gene_type:complete
MLPILIIMEAVVVEHQLPVMLEQIQQEVVMVVMAQLIQLQDVQ